MNDRHNNFNLIRLIAAAQVVFVHAFGFTELHETAPAWSKAVFEVIALFPGVPIFFICSGFLIAMSWERSSGQLGRYCWRRFLRIYPALVVCFAVSLLLLLAAGHLTRDFVGSGTFIGWVAGQLTFVQFFNPDALRGFGIGVLNGSLWTIAVELQFYAFIPLFYSLVYGRLKGSPIGNIVVVAVFSLSLCGHYQMSLGIDAAGGFGSASILLKLFHHTLVPHLWIFLFGVFAHRHWDRLFPKVEGKALLFVPTYFAAVLAIPHLPTPASAAFLLPLGEGVLMTLAVLSAAHTRPALSGRLLRGHDLSYGIYLYHFPIINAFVELGWMENIGAILAVAAIATAAAALSWRFVERPCMQLKRKRLVATEGSAPATPAIPAGGTSGELPSAAARRHGYKSAW